MRGLQVSSDMEKLTKEGINSFKFFLAYKGAMAVTDEQLLKGLRRSKELGALPMVSHICSHLSSLFSDNKCAPCFGLVRGMLSLQYCSALAEVC